MGTMLTSSICAYGLARIKWRGRNVVFACIISSMMLPAAVTLIPTFLMWRTIGITDSFYSTDCSGMVWRRCILHIPASSVFIWESRGILMRQHIWTVLPIFRFLQNYPANYKPALAVVGMFAFLNSWNDFLNPLVYLNSEKKYTVALGLQLFTGSYRGEWNLMMAAACLVLALCGCICHWSEVSY